MATLAEAVDAAETDWLVSADIPDSVDYLTVESEVVQVTATFPAQYQARDGSTSDPRIRVVRAAGGTTAASHADGTTLTPLIPPSASGGGAAEAGVNIDNTVDPPFLAATLLATGVFEFGAGVAALDGVLLTQDQKEGLDSANALAGGNPAATMDDLAALPGLPTLAAVLAEGNEVGGNTLVSADDVGLGATFELADASGNVGGRVEATAGTGASGDEGAKLVLVGGDDVATDSFLQGRNGAAGRSGSLAFIQGGDGDGGNFFGGSFDAWPGTESSFGKVQITSNNSSGDQGNLLTAEGGTANAVWQPLVTIQGSTPVGGPYITPLVFDSTATTGGLYFWTGADYSKIGLATA